jgi:hypothetical protein
MPAIAALNACIARSTTLRKAASIAIASPQRRSRRWSIRMYLQWPARMSRTWLGLVQQTHQIAASRDLSLMLRVC